MDVEPTAERVLEQVTDAWGILLDDPDQPRPAKRSKIAHEQHHAAGSGPEDPGPDGQVAE